MSPTARRLLIGTPVVAVLAVGALSVTVTPGRTWQLVDADGRPLAGAYVGYHYWGQEYRVVDAGSYRRPGAIARSDGAGRVHLPWALHVHRPRPLQSGPDPYLDLAYAPAVHNALAGLGLAAAHRPAVVPVPRRGAVDRRAGILTLADAGDDPEAWAAALEAVYGFVRFDVLGRDAAAYRAPAPILRELGACLGEEYRAFLARHRDAPRAVPPPGEARWGPFMERIWRGRLTELDRRLAARGA